MGQVPAMGEIHAQNRVARLHEGQVDRLVHGRARERLDVGVLAAKQLLGPLAGQLLDGVGELLAAVVAPARIALGVLVGEHRAQGGEHLGVGVVLGGDQLDAPCLPALLADEGLEELRVVLGEKLAVSLHGGS